MDPFDRILGRSGEAAALRAFGATAAAVDAAVLLTGESGTGKGLLARAIHDASGRARGPFVSVNCAALPEGLFESELFGHTRGAFTGAQYSHRGLFEQAHGGTLFLDEIGELAPPLQAKLLGALEDGEVRRLGAEHTRRVDFRLIAATNADLERAVADRSFRRDLLHRLLVLSFRLPALRERPDDLEPLIHHFLHGFARRYDRPVLGLEPAALARLHAYAWPGNVRELAHALEAAVLACDGATLRAANLPARILEPPTAAPVDAVAHTGQTDRLPPSRRYAFFGSPEEERRRIAEMLRRCDGNKTRAAAALGMARNTLRLKLRVLGLDARDEPAAPGQ